MVADTISPSSKLVRSEIDNDFETHEWLAELDLVALGGCQWPLCIKLAASKCN